MSRRRNLRWGVENAENALRRCHRALQHVELLRHIADGPEKPLRVHQERDKGTKRQAVLDDPTTTDPDDERRGKCAHELNGWIEDGIEENRPDVRVAMAPVDAIESGKIARLAPEQM